MCIYVEIVDCSADCVKVLLKIAYICILRLKIEEKYIKMLKFKISLRDRGSEIILSDS